MARVSFTKARSILWEMGLCSKWITLGIYRARFYEMVFYWDVTRCITNSLASSKNKKYLGFNSFTRTWELASILDDYPRSF